MSLSQSKNCPICNCVLTAKSRLDIYRDVLEVPCMACGAYQITDEAKQFGLGPLSQPEKMKLAAILRERAILGRPAPILIHEPTAGTPATGPTLTIAELLLGWPANPTERLERVLLNVGRLSSGFGHIVTYHPHDLPAFFARDAAEFDFILDHLRSSGMVGSDSKLGTNGGQFVVTTKGWESFEGAEEKHRTISSRVGFIAMDFDKALDVVHEQGLRAAIKRAKFAPLRADEVQHNEDIVDEIITSIRDCRFVVADMTRQNPGVYFEAGYAKGLGRPVIFTCREDDIDNMHFDIHQFNHVIWQEPGDLCESLYARIKATIG